MTDQKIHKNLFQQFPNGALLYDGTCGACSYFVGAREEFYSKYGFGVIPAQDESLKDIPAVNDRNEVREIRLLKSDGTLISGADVYREVCSKVWWLKPIGVLSQIPIFSSLFDFGYWIVAKNRHRISRVCGLQSRAKYK